MHALSALVDTPLPASPDTRKVVADIAGLNKFYGTFHVLHNIDLKVREGEHIVLCGPSGSGKSTLIRCINRLEIAEKGRKRPHSWAIRRQRQHPLSFCFKTINL